MPFIALKKRHFSSLAVVLTCSLSLSACLSTSFLRKDPAAAQQPQTTQGTQSPSSAQSANPVSSQPLSEQASQATAAASSAVSTLLSDARYAWDVGNMERAENLYKQAAETQNLAPAEKNEALERLALSAAYNGRPNSALAALDKWSAASPDVEKSSLWQDAWLSSMRNLSSGAQETEAAKVWAQTQRSSDVRALAAITLMGRSWDSEQSMQAVPLIREYYNKQDTLHKQNLERIASKEIQSISDSNLLSLSQKLVSSKDYSFPATIVLLEDGRRGLGLDANILGKVQDPKLYADQELAKKVLTGMDVGELTLSGNSMPSLALARANNAASSLATAGENLQGSLQQGANTLGDMASNLTGQSTCLVLALPQSGSLAAISQQVQAGANTAVQALSAQGKQVQIQYIDTTQANWLVQMQALPLTCAVVGGPIQEKNLSLAQGSGATVQRNFFAFMPSFGTTGAQTEGIDAWRFFPSHQDQAEAMIDFSRQMGINDYASFFPADAYGTSMNGVFSATVRANGGTVRSEGYVGSGSAVWNKAAQSLLQPRVVNGKPLSTANFGAIFVPDTWSNMDGIVSAFVQNGETRQLLLGTTIWGQSLASSGAVANADKFSLALFPAALNPVQNALGTASIWTAIGYDFVQLGASLGLPTVAPASLMNTKLQTAQNFSWAMSPIRWNLQGKASQKLMVFSVHANGIAPADPNVINQRRAEALTKFDAQSGAVK